MRTDKGFQVVKDFLVMANHDLQCGGYSENVKKARVDSFLFLLKLDAATIQRYWAQCRDEPFMIQVLKDEYAEACKQYEAWRAAEEALLPSLPLSSDVFNPAL